MNLPSTSSTNQFDKEFENDLFNEVHEAMEIQNDVSQSPFDEKLLDFAKEQDKHAIDTVIRLLADPSLSRKSIQKIVSVISEHNRNSVESLKNYLPDIFLNSEKFKAVLSIIGNSFHKFSTEHKTFKYLKEKKLLIEPVAVTIGLTRTFRRVRKKKLCWLDHKIQMHIVPMDRTLKRFFELPNVFKTISEILNKDYEDYPVYSMLQGQYWRDIKLRSPNKIIIPINIYFDDDEINNALGSHRVLKKMGAIYFTISCLPPQFSAKLENWFLAQIHKEQDYKRLGNKIMFKKIKKQLLDLQTNGLEIEIEGTSYTVFFEVCKILGDNLGFNQILGFETSFRANYFCRICTADSSITRVLTEEDEKLLRNENNYAEDVENLKDQKLRSSRGVKEHCVWEPVIEVTKLRCVDPLHDTVEGSFSNEIRIITKLAIKKKYFDIDTLNKNIELLVIDQASGVNKPPKFVENDFKQGKLKASASETSFTIQYFGILVGAYFPKNCRLWKLYKLLRKIYYLIMAPSFDKGTPEALKKIIKEHHTLFLKLKLGHLLPKHHFLLHYPLLMKLLGPLRFATSIRGEAFHSKFKRYAVVARSRKNPTYTLAMRHQLTLAKRFSDNTPLTNQFSCKYIKNIKISLLDNFESFKRFSPVDENQIVKLISWADYDGTLYRPGMIVVLDTTDKLPKFGEIIFIIEHHGVVLFIVNELETLEFNDHVQAYVIEKTKVFKFVQHKYLGDYMVFDSQSIELLDEKKSAGSKKVFKTKKVVVTTYFYYSIFLSNTEIKKKKKKVGN